jgi:hypothetical protein
MAYLAEVNSENLVINVIIVDDNDVLNNGGHASQETDNYFTNKIPLSTNGVKWIETFRNSEKRGRYAGIGYLWNEQYKIFCEQKIYLSWILNTTTGEYEAPVAKPVITDDRVISWNEDNKEWKSKKTIGNNGELLNPPIIETWNPNTSSWI